MREEFIHMTRDTFKNHLNLGGIDYIGRGPDQLRTSAEKKRVAEVCLKLGLTGLILVGATGTLTDGIYLS
jgi:6-phosphofructokinase